MRDMDANGAISNIVVDLAEWRRSRRAVEDQAPAEAEAHGRAGLLRFPEAAADEVEADRLERAVDRVHALVSRALDAQGRLQPRVETELLAIMGELTVGLVGEAAVRAERLADRLATRKGGVGR